MFEEKTNQLYQEFNISDDCGMGLTINYRILSIGIEIKARSVLSRIKYAT